ncbi:MAG TPA: SDR family NAD(P)-dependent oxidoreductase [Actinomycetota bacterium]|jgi:NAD(P)-dependent dehydrogenase (short-subunit alcohol dehydrogenase family)
MDTKGETGRTVLVTGGTGALGTVVTTALLHHGHRVAVTWVVKEEAEALDAALGTLDPERRMLVETDVTDEGSIGDSLQTIESQLGPVDVLVHLVGGWKGGERVHEHSLATWDRMHQLNLRSAFLCARAVLPRMLERDWGRIVLVSSRTARQDRAGQAAYAIAKAGVAVLAETIAEETVGTGVTANVIAPSTLDTPANRRAMPNADPSRWVSPAHVAASIAYLASEEAGQLRGAWLPAYGSA